MPVFGGEIGCKSAAPTKTHWTPRGSRTRKYGFSFRFNTRMWCHEFEDFNGSGTTLPASLTGATTETVGTPTVAKVADTANGEAAMTLEATDEAQSARISWGDQRSIPANSGWLASFYVKSTAVAANERWVVGVAHDHNATLDSNTHHAWFRCEASLALLVETDDATTDTDDQSTGKTLTAGTYALLQIDATRIDAIRFFVDGQYVGSTAGAAFSTTTLQPYMIVQKASGTGVPALTCDWFEVLWPREYS